MFIIRDNKKTGFGLSLGFRHLTDPSPQQSPANHLKFPAKIAADKSFVMNERRLTRPYIISVLFAGLVCIVFASATVPIAAFDLKLVLLFCLTIGFGSRVTVPIPRIKSHIAVSDTFIFLVLLLYGGEYAVIVAAVEAFASSWRFCNRKITVFFNAATMAVSTTAVVVVLKILGVYSTSQFHGQSDNAQSFVIALSVIALTQFIVNTTLASVYDSLKSSIPLWETWKSKYIWTFFTYFVGIGGASVLVQLSDIIGFGILVATFPLIFFVYLSYRMYLKNVEISVQQAEQAEEYAKTLESKSEALRRSEERFQHEATHDALTGLPNRPFFMSRLTAALAKTKREPDHKVSILFIDLDRFKYVNDSLGHLLGDQLLKGIAERLCDCMRPSDLVARLGGDEFTILVEGRYDVNEVTRIAERIQQKFNIPFDLGGHEVYSSASIGILHSSEQHLSSEDMMRDADTAMYQAKRAGKARHEIFDEKMHRDAKEILQLETDLRRAVERREISVCYQPIYTLASRQIEGLESLARWHHSDLGDIPPAKFIPLAEEIGLIDKLCEQVLQRSCQEIGSLKKELGIDLALSMSVNLSCKQFARPGLVKTIEEILRSTSFSPRDLKLEITESVFFEHPERAIEMLNSLRDLGIGIDVDDFGTGYSNLGYLMKLPISKLKIDRSFVSMIDSHNDEIVNAIIVLARNLGLQVIAEGVETESQLEQLKDLGCESGQGYLFAAPMPFAQTLEFLRSEKSFHVPAGCFDEAPATSFIK
jgi:diguanylate cyclase (GGDEF)-like protein